MKIPPIKEDESLAMWRARLVEEFHLDSWMDELLREVSVTSYTEGVHSERAISKKYGRAEG